MVPTKRTFYIGSLALVVALIGQGAAWSTYLAWTILGFSLVGFLADGILAGVFSRLRLERQAPGQLYVGQPQSIG